VSWLQRVAERFLAEGFLPGVRHCTVQLEGHHHSTEILGDCVYEELLLVSDLDVLAACELFCRESVEGDHAAIVHER